MGNGNLRPCMPLRLMRRSPNPSWGTGTLVDAGGEFGFDGLLTPHGERERMEPIARYDLWMRS